MSTHQNEKSDGLKIMTFDDFVKFIFPIVKYRLKNKSKKAAYWEQQNWTTVGSLKEVSRETRLEGDKVITGGTSGGSCWGGEPTPYTDNYTSPELAPLDEILEQLCPTISFLAYKKLLKNLEIEDNSETEYEYYGNSTNYAFKSVNLGKLWDGLQDYLPSKDK